MSGDELDGALLALLEVDGRLTNSELARRLEVSESYVRQRLKRLFGSGRVRRGVIVDFGILGIGTVAFLRLRFTATAVDAAVAELSQQPAMGLVMTVAGGFDVYAIAAVKDPAELGRFLDEQVRCLKGFLSAEVSLIDDAVKYDSRHAPLRLI